MDMDLNDDTSRETTLSPTILFSEPQTPVQQKQIALQSALAPLPCSNHSRRLSRSPPSSSDEDCIITDTVLAKSIPPSPTKPS